MPSSPGLFAFPEVRVDHQVKLFQLARDARPDAAPVPIEGFAVSAETLDGARSTALERLAAANREVRAISFLRGGGLAAVVHPPSTRPAAASAPARARSR